MSALVQTFRGRPVWLKCDGWWVCIAIHDAHFLRQRSTWKTRLLKRPSLAPQYQRWVRDEQAIYAILGLDPPHPLPPPINRGQFQWRLKPRRGPSRKGVRLGPRNRHGERG